jgi:ankyrin repeat protein
MFQDHYESQLDKFKESFLTEAARCGRTEEVASLIELGASPNGDQTQNQDTPLLAAVRCNHIDVATILIAHGANINAKTIGGNTALHLASLIYAIVLLVSKARHSPSNHCLDTHIFFQ